MASDSPSKAEMMKQAQNVWSMLDNMAADDPNSYKKFIDKNLKEGKEYMQWKKTPPDAHMCVQTKLLGSDSRTLYMNVCSWSRVPEPKSDDAPIPVMSSEIQILNANVSIVNVAFSPPILESYGRNCTNNEEQTALINLAIDYVQDVHKVSISRIFKILPEENCFHGNWEKIVESLRTIIDKNNRDDSVEEMLKSMQQFAPTSQLSEQTIVSEINKMRNDDFTSVDTSHIILPGSTAPPGGRVLIEEVEPETGQSSRSVVEPSYTIQCVNADIHGTRCLVLNIDLLGVKSVNECQLDLTETEVMLLVKNRYKLCLRLPESIKDDLSRAKFHKKTSTLTVTLPTIK